MWRTGIVLLPLCHGDLESHRCGPVCSQAHKLLLNLGEVCTSTNSLLSYGMYVAAHTYMFILELEDFPRNTTRKVFYSGSEEPGGGNSGKGQTLIVYRFDF